MEVVEMTPKLSLEAFAALGAPNIVYVKPVRAREVIGAAQIDKIEGMEFDPEELLYAVHRANGERLAVLGDRQSAMAAALANELAPVSVH
jgi:hypothetical protein